MGVRFADSFQHYDDTALKWNTPGGTFNTSAPLRHGPQNLQVTSADSPAYLFPGGSTLGSGITGLAWYAGDLSGRVFTFRSSGTDQVWVELHADGSITVETSLGQLGTSEPGVIALDTWYYIACKVAIDASVGSAILRVTEDATNTMTEVVNVSGVNTDPVGSFSFDEVALGGPTSSAAWTQDVVIQDFAAPNDDFLGAAYVNAFMPIADGAAPQNTPTPWQPALPHFSRVNEVPPDGGTTKITVQSNSFGSNVSECYHYDFSGLPALPIASIQSVADSAVNDDTVASPAGVSACFALISNPSTFADKGQPLREWVSDVYFIDISNSDLNPITELPWTHADLLDIQIGPHFGEIV